MVNNYNLVNPLIKGKVETTISAKNSREAASIIYTNLSEHFNNALPAFYFSLQKGGDGKFYHFKVTEKKNKNEINFNINEIQLENDNYINSEFKGKLKNIKNKMEEQDGGKKKSRKEDSKKKQKGKNNIDLESESEEQNGGKKKKKTSKKKTSKKKDDSDSSSDSSTDSSDSDDLYIKTRKHYYSEPIYWWWYDPLVYRLDKVFLPTFYSYVTPYVQLDTTTTTFHDTTTVYVKP